jgi:hypothetical protein
LDNVKQLKAALVRAQKNYLEAYERWSVSDNGAGPPKETDSDRISAMIAFEEHHLPYVETTSAIFLVKGKYYYVSTTGKWRVKGKQKWYRSKDVYQFIDKYVKKSQ